MTPNLEFEPLETTYNWKNPTKLKGISFEGRGGGRGAPLKKKHPARQPPAAKNTPPRVVGRPPPPPPKKKTTPAPPPPRSC